jgi:hypothetical protein
MDGAKRGLQKKQKRQCGEKGQRIISKEAQMNEKRNA